MIDGPGKVHVKLFLVHVVHHADHRSCRSKSRSEKWNAILEIQNGIVLMPEPPQVTCCRYIIYCSTALSHRPDNHLTSRTGWLRRIWK